MATTRSGGSRRGTLVATEAGPVRLPASARTLRQRVAWLLRRGYVWGAWMLAAHADTVVLSLLQRAYPDVPWKNIAAANRLGRGGKRA